MDSEPKDQLAQLIHQRDMIDSKIKEYLREKKRLSKRIHAIKVRLKYQKASPRKLNCKRCKQPFQTKHSIQKFCSNQCRIKYWNNYGAA